MTGSVDWELLLQNESLVKADRNPCNQVRRLLRVTALAIGGSRTIKEHETAQAMKICDEAGIDITRKAIWHGRDTILRGLKDAGLRTWLQGRARK